MVVLCGVPGTGKSTWCAVHLAGSHIVVSKDRMRNAPRKEARQVRELRAALSAGRSVVVDNTNLTRDVRAPILAIAREFGARCRAVVMDTSLETARARNAERTGPTRVPEGILFEMVRRWEPPTAEEGFDEVAWVVCEAVGAEFTPL